MATIRVEYAGEDGTTLMAEYTGVEAAVDIQTKLLTLTQHGVALGGLMLDVVMAEFPEGRYLRWEAMGSAVEAPMPMPAATVSLSLPEMPPGDG